MRVVVGTDEAAARDRPAPDEGPPEKGCLEDWQSQPVWDNMSMSPSKGPHPMARISFRGWALGTIHPGYAIQRKGPEVRPFTAH